MSSEEDSEYKGEGIQADEQVEDTIDEGTADSGATLRKYGQPNYELIVLTGHTQNLTRPTPRTSPTSSKNELGAPSPLLAPMPNLMKIRLVRTVRETPSVTTRWVAS